MDLQTLRSQYRDAILAIAAANKATNVRVFGSVARGDAGKNSDVDFLVTLLPGASLLDAGGMLEDLKEILGPRIDLVPDDCLHEYLRETVLREAIPL